MKSVKSWEIEVETSVRLRFQLKCGKHNFELKLKKIKWKLFFATKKQHGSKSKWWKTRQNENRTEEKKNKKIITNSSQIFTSLFIISLSKTFDIHKLYTNQWFGKLCVWRMVHFLPFSFCIASFSAFLKFQQLRSR